MEPLRESAICFSSLDGIVAHADIVVVAVQNPHKPEWEGVTTRLPDEPVDFELHSVVYLEHWLEAWD